MAIDNTAKTKIAPNLYLIGDYKKEQPTKFVLDFRHLKKRYRKVVTINNPLWDKRTRINEAKRLLQEYKEEVRQERRPDEKITITQLFNLYISQKPSTSWTQEQKRFFDNHIQPHIGSRRAIDLKPFEVRKIIAKMDADGYSKAHQAKVKRILNPMYKFAIENDILIKNPIERIIIKVPLQRKTITNAAQKFIAVYDAIKSIYKDDPYYQAIFLFGLFGRRKNEVLHLKWEDVDLINGYYWLQKTKAE
ncbi:site-specific integrase [Nitratiruptor tergarcus]|uniref:site-specific integrase n=1 Tax=Nitratiruptor tergarcus TaxID=269259 RepID=UPI000A071111|nr:site-specific integrase [Nitratiruptor tergarcus]